MNDGGYRICFDEPRKIVLLNALVVPHKTALMFVSKINPDEALEIIISAEVIESYIGHASTAKLLTELTGKTINISRAEYVPQNDDIALVVRLKRRLPQGQQDINVTLDDLEFYTVYYVL